MTSMLNPKTSMQSKLFTALRRGALGACLVGAALAAGCSSGTSTASLGQSAGPVNSLQPHPDTSIRSQDFVVDANERGASGQLRLLGMFWGRIVDVFDLSGALMATDYVIGENIQSDANYLVVTNAVTQRTSVTIRHLAGTEGYESAFVALDQNMTPVQDKSLDAAELGPYSMVPRNSAMVLRFNDLLEQRFKDGFWRDNLNNATVNRSTGQLDNQLVKIQVGYPPVAFYEGRMMVDRNHGDLADYDGDDVQEFHSTRIVIANAVSLFDAELANPPLAVNSLGLPGSTTVAEPNGVIRISTQLDTGMGQILLLRSAGGASVSADASGSRDTSINTLDVVRAFRSGGDQNTTGDLNNGFLADDLKPNIIGNMGVTLTGAVIQDPTDPTGAIYLAGGLNFLVSECATLPEVGDVIIQQIQELTRAEIVSFQVNNGLIQNLKLRVVQPIGGSLVGGAAQLLTAFNPASDNPPCFLRFAPDPAAAPAAGVSKASQVFLAFSEPMDPTTLKPFDTYSLQRVASNPDASDFVIASITSNSEQREFGIVPTMPMAHASGTAETYYLRVAPASEGGPTDLAGNRLQFDLPLIPFTLEPSEGTETNGGFAFRFNQVSELALTPDEIAGVLVLPEFRSRQIVYDLIQEILKPRPVSRRAIAADRDKPVPGNMTPFPQGVQTPLSPLGSKCQALYRYCDLGWTVQDETNYNVDIEGLAWSPVGGTVVSDSYTEFQIGLAHGRYLPDEPIDSFGFPIYEFSGLNANFDGNLLDQMNVVHPKPRGYVVTQADAFIAESGTTMVPWPLNQGVPVEEFNYWTWRDTRDHNLIGALANAGQGAGVPLDIEYVVNGWAAGDPPKLYGHRQVKAVGLAMMMEFRCYPDNAAFGLNPFDISIAINTSARPAFRAFSTGGFNTANQQQIRNPDQQTTALGGFNPGSTPAGLPTPGLDNVFYIGQVELVTRISVAHSIWFDTGFTTPVYVDPVMEPLPSKQPAGTQIVFDYRGATAVTQGSGPNTSILNSAESSVLGWYGAPLSDTLPGGDDNGSPAYSNGDDTWKSNISEIDGSKFFQVRMTFIANAASNQVPFIDSLGLSFRQ